MTKHKPVPLLVVSLTTPSTLQPELQSEAPPRHAAYEGGTNLWRHHAGTGREKVPSSHTEGGTAGLSSSLEVTGEHNMLEPT